MSTKETPKGRRTRRTKKWLLGYIKALEAEIIMLRACNHVLTATRRPAQKAQWTTK